MRSEGNSAKRYRKSQTRLTSLLVLAVHVFRRLSQRQNRRVEIDTMPRRNLVAGDRIRGPRFDCAKCTPLDTRNLHVTGDWIAGHAQVMFERRLRSVLDHPRFSAECGSD